MFQSQLASETFTESSISETCGFGSSYSKHVSYRSAVHHLLEYPASVKDMLWSISIPPATLISSKRVIIPTKAKGLSIWIINLKKNNTQHGFSPDGKIFFSVKNQQLPRIKPRAPGLSHQCSTTKLQQLELPQSPICTAQIVLMSHGIVYTQPFRICHQNYIRG